MVILFDVPIEVSSSRPFFRQVELNPLRTELFLTVFLSSNHFEFEADYRIDSGKISPR